MKKIVSLILAVVALLTFAAVPTFATSEADKTDLDFITSLGFVKLADGEEILADTVMTRIELAEIFYNIVFPTQNIQSEYWGAADFPDVPTEQKHIAAAVYGMGVMRGYSDTVFAPNDPVTYLQAVKAMVSFLGYDLQANMIGGYPAGYLSQATRLQILPGGNIAGDAQATYGGIAAMLKKAIGVDIAIWNNTSTDGTGVQDVQEGVDYLKYYRGINVTRGIVTGNYLTNIKGGSSTNFSGVYVNGHQMEVAEGAHGLQEMLGYDTYVYYTDVDGYKTAVYFEGGVNEVVEISSNNIASVAKGTISYYMDDSSDVYKANFAADAPLIYNGTFESSYSINDLNPFTAGNLDGSITLIDTGNDGTYDNIVVKAYQTIVVNDVRNNKIYGMYNVSSNPLDKVIDVTNYKERNINLRDITGDMIELSLIKKGVVINVCRDKNGVVKEIIASKDSMTGVLEEISYSGNKISAVTISGMTFPASSGIMVIDSANKLAPGLTADIFFNCDAEVALIDVQNRYADGYTVGYLVDAGVEGGLQKSVPIMIFNSEGKMNTYSLSERVAYNGAATDAQVVLSNFGKTGDRVKRQLILYKTDLDGKVVTAIQTATELTSDSQAFNGFYQYPGDEFYYAGGHKSFDSKYLSNASTVVFGVPSEEDRDSYEDYVLSSLPSGEGNNIGSKDNPASMLLYGTKEQALVVDYAVINTRSGGTSGLDRRPLFVVSKVATAIDDDGEEGLRITGHFIEGTSLGQGSFFIDPQLFIDGHDKDLSTNYVQTGTRPFIDQNETMPEPGDIFKFTSFATTGRIDVMNVQEIFQLYDYGTDSWRETTGYVKDYGREVHHYFGTVVYKDGTSIKVRLLDGTYAAFELSSGYYKFIEMTKQASNGQVHVEGSSEAAILSEETHPGEASRVLVFTRGAGIGCIVLNY